MFQASQLSEISSRFPAHVHDIREFLLKGQLPVPSPNVISQLSSRLGSDRQFRADVASLMRAILYQEREDIGYEDLLGILVVAAAGTEHDLKGDSQEADIREMLRFLLQSRRSTFPPETEKFSPEAEVVKVKVPDAREPLPAGAVRANSEPVLRTRGGRSPAHSIKLELRPELQAAVAEAESREPDDLVLQPFRTAGLFAAHAELEAPRWRSRSVWILGAVCILLGLGLGLMIHRLPFAAETHGEVRAAYIGPMIHHVASATETHLGVRAADIDRMIHDVVSTAEAHVGVHAAGIPSSSRETVGSVAPKESVTERSNALGSHKPWPGTSELRHEEANMGEGGAGKAESPTGTTHARSIENLGGTAVQPALSDQIAPATAESSSGMPVTVVKQVVTASPSGSADSGELADAAQSTTKTRSIVPRGSASIMPADVIFSPPPKYPAAAAVARVQGEVTVHAVLDPEGKVIYARAVSGPSLLRDAATDAVQRWRYRPLLDNGKPIAVTTVAILDFKFAK